MYVFDQTSKRQTALHRDSFRHVSGGCGPTLHILQDAMPGVRSHGVVTGIQEYGLFISFFGGVSGLAHASQLGLAREQTPADAFKVCLLNPCHPHAHAWPDS